MRIREIESHLRALHLGYTKEPIPQREVMYPIFASTPRGLHGMTVFTALLTAISQEPKPPQASR